MNKLILKPIGTVHSPYKKETKGDYPERNMIEARIEIFPEFSDGLYKISEFSELWILFWFSGIEEKERATLKVHPRRNENNPMRGVFSSRSPARPNPIGLTKVTLLKVENNIIFVRGLDAYDRTPVIDIKEV
ncbi:MAG: tRNA (N6-threonylcarbamoyladenosine(37)-N6)-methyltransferase TrmO [bacterium]|mgnify:CR=1 FL=1|nr:tRNA (N6-threonylcarbamoyladenosine(37)-N6)-methyltransferase TrmO [bacterium]